MPIDQELLFWERDNDITFVIISDTVVIVVWRYYYQYLIYYLKSLWNSTWRASDNVDEERFRRVYSIHRWEKRITIDSHNSEKFKKNQRNVSENVKPFECL